MTPLSAAGTNGAIMPLCSEGRISPWLMNLLRANSREPDRLEGDIYALVASNDAGANRLIRMRTVRDFAWYYPYTYDFALHGLPTQVQRAPWYSAMSQGMALDLFTRLAQVTGDPVWRDAADHTFESFLLPPKAGVPWVVHTDASHNLWLEEYPRWPWTTSDFTLNGHLFAEYFPAPDFNADMRAALKEVGQTLALIGTDKVDNVLAGIVESMPSLAKELGKEPPKITIADNGIVVRTQVIGLLKNVFTHLFRNSMDHGLETADVRQAAGKGPVGHIQLALNLDGGKLQFKLGDDGKGLAVGRIRQKAIENGVMDASDNKTPEEIAQLIFASGFSTAEKVTEVSYFDVEVWGPAAENCNKYLKKGSGIIVEGRLKQDRWEKDGKTQSKVRISANSVHFMPKRADEGAAAPTRGQDDTAGHADAINPEDIAWSE